MPDVNNPTEPVAEIETTRDQTPETFTDATQQVVEALGGDAEVIDTVQDRLIDTVTATQQEAIETLESAGQVFFSTVTRVQEEVAGFLAERIRQDLDTQQALLRCRTLHDVRDVQASFVRTALGQYGDEVAKLVRMGSEVAAKSLDRPRA